MTKKIVKINAGLTILNTPEQSFPSPECNRVTCTSSRLAILTPINSHIPESNLRQPSRNVKYYNSAQRPRSRLGACNCGGPQLAVNSFHMTHISSKLEDMKSWASQLWGIQSPRHVRLKDARTAVPLCMQGSPQRLRANQWLQQGRSFKYDLENCKFSKIWHWWTPDKPSMWRLQWLEQPDLRINDAQNEGERITELSKNTALVFWSIIDVCRLVTARLGV